MNQSGVYMIKNLINGKVYIGSSKDITKRWKHHRRELQKNRHENQYLQRAWNKHGERNFEFSIIEDVVPKKQFLFKIEQKYYDIFQSFSRKRGYNLSPISEYPDNTGSIRNDLKKRNIETAKPIYQYDLNEIFIREWKSASEASRKLGISNSQIGDVCHHRGVKTAGGFFWRFKSEIKDKKIKEKFINPYYKPILQYDLSGYFIKEWTYMQEASDELKIHSCQISEVCSGKEKSAGGFMWRYKIDDRIDYKISEVENNKTKILQYDLNGIFIREWSSINEAVKGLKTTFLTIKKICDGRIPTKKQKYIFKYKENA